MRVTLEYGKTGLDVELPADRVVRSLGYKNAPPLADPAGELARKLAAPTGTPPLAELARGRTSACIVICDITRPVPNQLILTPSSADARSGRHPARQDHDPGRHRTAPPERRRRTGRDGRPGDCRHTTASKIITARSSPSTRFWATARAACRSGSTRRYVEADLKITTGLIEPHLMAGFSGGRKLICPGIAALETVKVWHGPAFPRTPQRRLRHSRRQPGP